MDWLADTNIFVRAVERSHPSSKEARNALKALRLRGDRICVGAQKVVEFWSVCTRPVTSNGLGLSVQQTQRHITRIEALFHFLPDVPDIYEEWKRIVRDAAVSGMQVYDARLFAAMKVYSIARALTFNVGDFKRYPGIRAILPEEVIATSPRA
jgi:predicted nucleic acid-binding protein